MGDWPFVLKQRLSFTLGPRNDDDLANGVDKDREVAGRGCVRGVLLLAVLAAEAVFGLAWDDDLSCRSGVTAAVLKGVFFLLAFGGGAFAAEDIPRR